MLTVLSAKQIDDLVAAEYGPRLAELGFRQRKARSWIRSDRAPIRELFEIAAWKGSVLRPRWGVSLDFVPHPHGRSWKWHRTDRSASLVLHDDPAHYSDIPSVCEFSRHVFRPNPLSQRGRGHGGDPYKDAADSAELSAELARLWFEQVDGVASLPRLFNLAKERQGGWFDLLFLQRLALAFVLRSLGDFDQAESELSRWLERYRQPAESIADLRSRFAATPTLREG
jgi:hypothetical protein